MLHRIYILQLENESELTGSESNIIDIIPQIPHPLIFWTLSDYFAIWYLLEQFKTLISLPRSSAFEHGLWCIKYSSGVLNLRGQRISKRIQKMYQNMVPEHHSIWHPNCARFRNETKLVERSPNARCGQVKLTVTGVGGDGTLNENVVTQLHFFPSN